MPKPEVLSFDALRDRAARSDTRVFGLRRFSERIGAELGGEVVATFHDLPGDVRTLIVVGGGAVIDRVKFWRKRERPELELVAVPSLWGSGAEASKVVAFNEDGRKFVEVDDALLPDARAVWPELADGLPEWRAREACGDAWSHAIEGFLSPLGTEELRAEIAGIMNTMLALPLGNDPAWFEPSAAACAAQARAGVGLVHGIAHTIESEVAELSVDDHGFGHARLCSIFLRPVMALNRELSPKFDDFTAAHGVDGAAVLRVCDALFDAEAYDACLPALEASWRSVLLDPCSRTNSALVRPAHVSFFTEKRFL